VETITPASPSKNSNAIVYGTKGYILLVKKTLEMFPNSPPYPSTKAGISASPAASKRFSPARYNLGAMTKLLSVRALFVVNSIAIPTM